MQSEAFDRTEKRDMGMKGSGLLIRDFHAGIGKREIIKGVSFCCEPQLIGLLGDNGSGKTTLIKGILQLGDWQRGRVALTDGTELALLSIKERAKYLAYVPQETAALRCQVREFAAMGRNPYLSWLSRPGREDYQAAEEALFLLGIGHLSHRYLDQLSGGERKMAYLARARVQDAPWLLLDEPAAGLDFKRQHGFLQALKRSVTESGKGAIFSVHDPLLAYRYCDRVLFLEEGRLTGDIKRTEEEFERRFRREFGPAFWEEGQDRG